MSERTIIVEAQDRETLFSRIRDELMGCCFSTAKELRHLAERCGFNFVPVEVVFAGDREAHLVLNPKGIGEIHVYADRALHWHPFYVRAIERSMPA